MKRIVFILGLVLLLGSCAKSKSKTYNFKKGDIVSFKLDNTRAVILDVNEYREECEVQYKDGKDIETKTVDFCTITLISR